MASLTLFMVLVTFIIVVLRYGFNLGWIWLQEMVTWMHAAVFLLAAAYTFSEDAHVRVDVFYARLSVKRKAITDLLTSVFFFIFAGTLLGTGYIFFSDSIGVWEVSFTEWAIQYWPVKATIILGAVLILFQGIAKVTKDVQLLLSRNGG